MRQQGAAQDMLIYPMVVSALSEQGAELVPAGTQSWLIPLLSGGSDTLVDASMNTTPTSVLALSQAEERSSWSGSQQTVVEKETDASLSARGPYLRPTAWPQPQGTPRQANTPAPRGAEVRHLGVEPLVRASRANLVGTSWGSEDSLSVASDPYGSAFSLYRGRALSLHV